MRSLKRSLAASAVTAAIAAYLLAPSRELVVAPHMMQDAFFEEELKLDEELAGLNASAPRPTAGAPAAEGTGADDEEFDAVVTFKNIRRKFW